MKAGLNNLFKDDLLRHTVILFSGMMVVHISNLAFQMLVSRKLPEIEYALLTAFLALIGIISYPLLTLTTGVSHYASIMRQQERTGDIKRLLQKWLGLTGAVSGLLCLLTITFNGPVSAFLHFDRAAPVIIAGAVLPALFWFHVLMGAAQGMQLFGWNSLAGILGALFKLIVGAGLVWFWYPACGWAMVGHSGGIYVSAAIILFGLAFQLRGDRSTTEALPSLRGYLGRGLFVQIAFAVLMNADVILVKHFLPDDTEFPYAATLGRIVAFMPMAIAFAMFPKVSAHGAYNDEHRRIFLRSFGYTALCVAGAALACLIMPGFILRILFGITDATPTMLELTRLMTLAMSACALLNTTVQFLLAQRRFAPLIITILCCPLYLLAARLFHAESAHIAIAAIAFNTLALVSSLLAAARKPHSPQAL